MEENNVNPNNTNKSAKETDTDQHRDQEPANAVCQDRTRTPGKTQRGRNLKT